MTKELGARTFNGKRYIFARTHRKKSDAEQEARKIRRSGALARITEVKQGYEVWYRRK